MKPATRRLLNFMLAHRGQWQSGNRLFEVAGTRYVARLFELRHDHGYEWEKRYVRGSHVPEYCLPAEPVQQSLTAEIEPGNYLLVCAEPAYIAHTQAHGNGTHVLTVKGYVSKAAYEARTAEAHL